MILESVALRRRHPLHGDILHQLERWLVRVLRTVDPLVVDAEIQKSFSIQTVSRTYCLSYILDGHHVTWNSSSPPTERLLPMIRPRNVTSTSRPRITDSAFSRRYCKTSIMPTSKKSKRRAVSKDERRGRIKTCSTSGFTGNYANNAAIIAQQD